MTPSDMSDLLGYRLEDPSGDIYTTALKVLMINRAQVRVYTELNQHVVPELRSRESDLALDEYGAFDSGDLTNTILGGISGGVFDVQDASEDYFTNLISFDEYRQSQNSKTTFSSSRPKRYIYGNEQFFLPFTTPTAMANTDEFVAGSYYYIKTWETGDDFSNVGGSNDGIANMRFKATASGLASTFSVTSVVYKTAGVNVYYKKQPTQITDTLTEEFTVESELVHDAIAYMAESLCWHINRDQREQQAIEQCSSLLQTLNETIADTDSNSRSEEGIYGASGFIEPRSTWEN